MEKEKTTTTATITVHWHKYPEEKPNTGGKQLKQYLTRSVEKNLFDVYRPVYRLCDWVDWDNLHGWYYSGNEFWLNEFEYLDIDEVYPK